jgi:hypothetical protein
MIRLTKTCDGRRAVVVVMVHISLALPVLVLVLVRLCKIAAL